MQRLLQLSNIAAPYQIRFCGALSRHFETRFLFYERTNNRVPLFWGEKPLGPNAQVLPKPIFRRGERYFTTAHLPILRAFNPDIVMLGGFSIPANYLAYRWAKGQGKKVVVLTEQSRDAHGKQRGGIIWSLIRKAYQNVDAVFALTPEAYTQFHGPLGFGDCVVQARYASDLDAFFRHPLRSAPPHPPTILFANRLAEQYNPLAAIEVLRLVRRRFPTAALLMNATGPLRRSCEQQIREQGLDEAVEFLDQVQRWDDLHLEYARAHVLLLPAVHSKANFTIYEAAASGLGLVISEAVAGNGAAVGREAKGFRLPPDPARMAEAVGAYFADSSLLTEHGAHNRAWVQPFGMDGTAALYATLLAEL